ncbi:MAG TPA: hypothetical protein GX707_13045 [Epulopiscium sp.]|nr:hypothetical protein [Candidatus Epulonipiscium sp.]
MVKNKADAEEFIEIVLLIEEYLEKTPDHQLSDYKTGVLFHSTISGRPYIFKFSNAYSDGAHKGKIMDGFYEMVLYNPPDFTWDLSEFVDIEHCINLESLIIESEFLLDNMEDFKKLTQLKYFEIDKIEFPNYKEEVLFEKELKENLPKDCEVSISIYRM